MLVRPDDDHAAVATGKRVGLNARALLDAGGGGARHRGAAMQRAADQRAAATGLSRHGNQRAGQQRHVFSQHLDAAAARADGSAVSGERAAHLHLPGGATVDDDLAIALDHGSGAHDAAGVDHGVEHGIA